MLLIGWELGWDWTRGVRHRQPSPRIAPRPSSPPSPQSLSSQSCLSSSLNMWPPASSTAPLSCSCLSFMHCPNLTYGSLLFLYWGCSHIMSVDQGDFFSNIDLGGDGFASHCHLSSLWLTHTVDVSSEKVVSDSKIYSKQFCRPHQELFAKTYISQHFELG